jgi:hypothetical protein
LLFPAVLKSIVRIGSLRLPARANVEYLEVPGSVDGFGLAKWVRKHYPGLDVVLTGTVPPVVPRRIQSFSMLAVVRRKHKIGYELPRKAVH